MLTEKQKKSADVFTLIEARFTEAASTYAAAIRDARFLLADAQRKSKSRAADATARQRICAVMTVAAARFWMTWGSRLPIRSAVYGAFSAAASTSKPLTVNYEVLRRYKEAPKRSLFLFRNRLLFSPKFSPYSFFRVLRHFTRKP